MPPPRVRATPRALTVACAVIQRRGALLVARRAGDGLFGGLWELPSAEVPRGAEALGALRAALAERGLRVEPGAELATVERVLTHRRVTFTALACQLVGKAAPGHRFATFDEIDTLGLSTAMKRVIEALRAAPVAARGGRVAKNRSPRAEKTLTPRGRTV